MAAKYRYPFPPNPDGWYLLMESAALAIGDVKPLHYFGRDLVLYLLLGDAEADTGVHRRSSSAGVHADS